MSLPNSGYKGNHMDIALSKLKEINLATKDLRITDPYNDDGGKTMFQYVREQVKGVNAVSVCFTDIEGKLHMLDYDMEFFINNADNLTFDGSSISGFSKQSESDLILKPDWNSVYLIPFSAIVPYNAGAEADINRIVIFASVLNRDGEIYHSDFRARLKKFLETCKSTVNVAAEIEGFLFKGKDAEQKYSLRQGTGGYGSFDFVNSGGYFNTLPGDSLRRFIDEAAAIQRAAGFENEKDHPEVAPSQFELNWKYTTALIAADQIQLYKLICRRTARNMGYTASFLPKPVADVNGNGMHINISLSENDINIFHGTHRESLSEEAWKFIRGILSHAEDLCLICNSSVNSYRRLDPRMEAPNEIKVSAIDRGSMIRIPFGNKKSARIELRTVSPDANPYLLIYAVVLAGLTANHRTVGQNSLRTDILPSSIYQAMRDFSGSKFITEIMGEAKMKFLDRKQASADRCPKLLGTTIKTGEIVYHHEVTNQSLWNGF